MSQATQRQSLMTDDGRWLVARPWTHRKSKSAISIAFFFLAPWDPSQFHAFDFPKISFRRKIIFLFVGPSEVRGELVKLQQVKQKCGLVFSLG